MKKLVALVIALVMVAACATCFADGLIKVGFAQVGHESDWRAANTNDYQTVFTAENGYELLFVDADNNHQEQLNAVQNFINQEVDYIVICPVQEAGWEVTLQAAKDAGIPVIVADRAVSAPDELYTAKVYTDMYTEGKTAGLWLEEYMGDKDANILVIEGSVGASASIGRTNGFADVAAQHANWKIIDSQSGDFTQAGGQQVMESYIKSYPGQFNVVVCQNDNEAYGAMDAMKAAGITYGVNGDVTIISFDATHDGIAYTFAGDITCNVECNPLQAETVSALIKKIEAGEEFAFDFLVPDAAFCAPTVESAVATTLTDEVVAGRKY